MPPRVLSSKSSSADNSTEVDQRRTSDQEDSRKRKAGGTDGDEKESDSDKEEDIRRMSLKKLMKMNSKRLKPSPQAVRLAEERKQKKREKTPSIIGSPKRDSSPAMEMTPDPEAAPAKLSVPSGPRIHIVNGRIQMDMDSLVVVNNAAENQDDLEVVDESASVTKITSASFMRNKITGHRWTAEETAKFYKLQSNLDNRVEARSRTVTQEELDDALKQAEEASEDAPTSTAASASGSRDRQTTPPSNEASGSSHQSVPPNSTEANVEEDDPMPQAEMPVIPKFVAKKLKPTPSSSVSKGPSFKPKVAPPRKKPAAPKDDSQQAEVTAIDTPSEATLAPEEAQKSAEEERPALKPAPRPNTIPVIASSKKIVKPHGGKPIMTAALLCKAEEDARGKAKLAEASEKEGGTESDLVHETSGADDAIGGEDYGDD
ncbi:hypothetical protein HDV05_007740 [Chytridiales sp. JEL 0842]|nr:hypothetical protein HDV05_007740 [Chytridiales sp. JEL 0842]